MDSGIRRGADVLKALALGADAVLVGRLYAYGLAVGGAAGVEAVIRQLAAQFDLTMALQLVALVGEVRADGHALRERLESFRGPSRHPGEAAFRTDLRASVETNLTDQIGAAASRSQAGLEPEATKQATRA